jgi:hypothetical protein
MAAYRVVENRERGRVLAEGSEEEMHKYVEMHFPRHHVDPGGGMVDSPVADVHVVSPEGGHAHYVGGEWGDPDAVKDEDDGS